MRKLILSMNVSLDGFIEGQDGDLSWLQPDAQGQWDDQFTLFQEQARR